MKPSFHWKCKQYTVVKTINEHNNIVCKGAIMNNIHDKIFTYPKCTNKTLYPVNGNRDIIGIGYHEVCICDECASELWSEPQYDNTVKFVDISEEE